MEWNFVDNIFLEHLQEYKFLNIGPAYGAFQFPKLQKRRRSSLKCNEGKTTECSSECSSHTVVSYKKYISELLLCRAVELSAWGVMLPKSFGLESTHSGPHSSVHVDHGNSFARDAKK